MTITLIVWLGFLIGFLGGAALASLRKPPLHVRPPDRRLTPLVPAVPTQTRWRHGDVWTN